MAIQQLHLTSSEIVIGTFSDDGAELMIKHNWLEKIPGAIERDALIKS